MSRVRVALAYSVEFLYLVDLIFFLMLLAGVVFLGVNPAHSVVFGLLLGVTLVGGTIHRVIRISHRHEIAAGPEHHAARERRGF